MPLPRNVEDRGHLIANPFLRKGGAQSLSQHAAIVPPANKAEAPAPGLVASQDRNRGLGLGEIVRSVYEALSAGPATTFTFTGCSINIPSLPVVNTIRKNLPGLISSGTFACTSAAFWLVMVSS